MVFKLNYYPDSSVGIFGRPNGEKGICSYHIPGLKKIAEIINNIPGITIHKEPYHLSLEAETPKKLSKLAFSISEQLADKGIPYSLPFDYSQIEEV